MSECLKAVLTQQLLPAATERGRVAAVEVLVATRAIQAAIRESNNHLIPGIISTGRKYGMQTMNQAIRELALNGRILTDVADEKLEELALATTA